MILMVLGLSKWIDGVATEMGKTVEGVGLNILILSSLLDIRDISC